MIPIPPRTAVLVAILETTLGTAGTLTSAGAGYRVMNPIIKPSGNSAVIPAGTGNADIGVVTGQYSADMSFDLQLYSGAWRHLFLPSCGFDDSTTTDTFLFTDDTSKWKGITAGLFYGGSKKYGTFGAMGSFGIKFPTGQVPTASFKYKGLWLPNPGTLPTGITWETTLPHAYAGSNSLAIGGDATIACGTVELSTDDNAVLIPSPNVAGAYVNAWLKKPSFRIKVDPRTTAAKDWITDWIAGTSTTISIVLGTTAGNIVTITATVAQASAPDHQEEDEQLVTPIEFAVLNNSLQIVFS